MSERKADKAREADISEAKKRREEALERRKRTAFRVIDGGGTMREAEQEARVTHNTLKRWIEERGRP